MADTLEKIMNQSNKFTQKLKRRAKNKTSFKKCEYFCKKYYG